MKVRYIGDGEDSPRRILFMGKVPFELDGNFVEVTDPAVCAKLNNHRCFEVKAGDEIAEAEFHEPDNTANRKPRGQKTGKAANRAKSSA